MIYLLIVSLFEMKALFYDQDCSILTKCNLNSVFSPSRPQKAHPKTKQNKKLTWVLFEGQLFALFPISEAFYFFFHSSALFTFIFF